VRPLLLAGLLSCLGACRSYPNLVEPTVVIETAGGLELGVSTDYGVVFLGQKGRTGQAEMVAFFGDGPSIEPILIEPLGAGLFLAQPGLELPAVQLTFADPAPGTRVQIRGRGPDGPWSSKAWIAADPRVEGLLLEVPEGFRLPNDQIGAGVYLREPGAPWRLLGLVSGHLALSGTSAEPPREFLTAVGPRDLWRLPAHRREAPRRYPAPTRPDLR
jgi:hypothetical protein